MLRNTFATTDLLALTPSSANVVKTLVYYSDKTTSAYTGGNEAHSLAAAAKATICATPAASTVRDIDHVIICATGGANTLQVVQTISATDYIITQAVLATNETLEYTHARGWITLDANGQEKLTMPGYLPLTGGTLTGTVTGTNITLTGRLLVADGTEVAPSIAFASDTSNGFHLEAAGVIDVNADSQFRIDLNSQSTIYDFQLGALLVAPDNTIDLGASGANRFRDLFLGRNAVITGDLAVNGGDLTTSATTFTALAGATTLLTLGGTGASSVVAIPGTLDASGTTGALTVAGGAYLAKSLIVAGAGPHAIGGATLADAAINIIPTFAGTANNLAGLRLVPILSPVADKNAFAFNASGTLNEAGSGTHADFGTMQLQPPTITGGVAALTNASTLKITGAPTGATNNYAFWVAAGEAKFDGTITSNGSAGLTQGSTATLGKSITVVNGLVTAFA